MRPRRLLTALFLVLSASISLGQEIPNWPTPSSWTPPADELSKLVLSPPLPFAPITPCRVVDTRPSQGFSGAYGPPIMAANATRDFPIATAPHCPDIPDSAAAYSLNITVTETAGPGDIRVWPTGNPPLVVSTQNWPAAGATLANAAIVPAGTSGSITVQIAGSNTHLIIDINGIFYNDLAPPHRLSIFSNSPGEATILGVNLSTAAGSHAIGGFAIGGMVHGVEGQIAPATVAGSSAVHGLNNSTNGGTYGVFGEVTSTSGLLNSAGVLGKNAGTTVAGYGVWGQHNGIGVGVFGSSTSTSGGFGVVGTSAGTSSISLGVRGVTASTAAGAAGVEGRDGTGFVNEGSVIGSAGVKGVSKLGVGVLGITDDPIGEGVLGVLNDSTGMFVTGGVLGYSETSGIHFFNGLSGTGAKAFVEPHPTDASKLIKYVSLEGNEAGTYFRGRSRFERGMARIAVPEDFRMVTDPESLSVQVTPIGEMTTFAVVRIDLNEIVVKGSRNVEFFYLVHGVRRAYRDWNPIWPNRKEFVPESETAKLPAYLSEDERMRLISNGTYNPDGTVNLETARRLGWDKAWKGGREPESASAQP